MCFGLFIGSALRLSRLSGIVILCIIIVFGWGDCSVLWGLGFLFVVIKVIGLFVCLSSLGFGSLFCFPCFYHCLYLLHTSLSFMNYQQLPETITSYYYYTSAISA